MAASSFRGWRLLDLGFLAVLALVLCAAMVAYAQGVRAVSNRIACENNLRRIGLAMVAYANSETQNGLSFPRAQYEPDEPLHFFTGANQPNTFGANAPQTNDVTAAFYLVLKTQQLDPRVMRCPESKAKLLVYGSEPGAIAKSVKANSNFPGIEYLSYSMQNPYGGKDALMTGFKWNVTLAADFALVADLNPGETATRLRLADTQPAANARRAMKSPANSPNHNGEGQNVLYADAHVEWRTDPFAGAEITAGTNTWRDNIYTARSAADQQTGGKIYAPPFDSYDNILLPAQGYKASDAGK
jgi:prepilin-type processing-associated H-X9-DG protein